MPQSNADWKLNGELIYTVFPIYYGRYIKRNNKILLKKALKCHILRSAALDINNIWLKVR